MSRLTIEQTKSIKSKCTPKEISCKDDFITRLSYNLRLKRKQPYLSYGSMVELFIEEADISYLEAHQMDAYKLKRIYRELCKKEEVPENKFTMKYYEDGTITIGGF